MSSRGPAGSQAHAGALRYVQFRAHANAIGNDMPNIGQIDRVGLHQRLHLIVVRGRDPRDTLLQTKTIDPVRPSHASIDLEHQHIRSADDALTMLAFAPPATKASAACWRAPGDISQPRIFPGRRT
eukprot:scaffold7028_cov243-Pinguiococcus_pyrenoidosus.AAC.19